MKMAEKTTGIQMEMTEFCCKKQKGLVDKVDKPRFLETQAINRYFVHSSNANCPDLLAWLSFWCTQLAEDDISPLKTNISKRKEKKRKLQIAQPTDMYEPWNFKENVWKKHCRSSISVFESCVTEPSPRNWLLYWLLDCVSHLDHYGKTLIGCLGSKIGNWSRKWL